MSSLPEEWETCDAFRWSVGVARLEELTKGAVVRGVLGERKVRVVDVTWYGSSAIILTFTDELSGGTDQELLYRDDESRLIVQQADRGWSLDGDGQLSARVGS